jgi:copper chaperone CopZ
VKAVRSALASVDGVEEVEIDFAAKKAHVAVAADPPDNAALVAAVEKAGFGAEIEG